MALIAATFRRFFPFFHDDSFITLRYARNLAETGELVWNPGGAAIEGYTSLLHVLVVSVGIALGADPMVAIQAVNIAGFILLFGALWACLRALESSGFARIAALAVLASQALIAWVWGGLEGGIAAAFVAFGSLYVIRAATAETPLRYGYLASFAFGLAYLTRPEMALANFAAGLGFLVFSQHSFRERLAGFFAIGSVSVLIVALHLTFRVFTYGEWVPLTYHAKVGLDASLRLANGMQYLINSLPVAPVLLLAPIVAIFGARSVKPAHPGLGIAASMLAVQTAVLIWLGGDHMPQGRMLIPLLPAGAILLATAVDRLDANATKLVAVVALACSAVLLFVLPPGKPDPAAQIGSAAGTYLNETFEEPITIAAATAGSTPFFATKHRFIDTLGLNDPTIARRENVPIRTPWQKKPGHGKGDGAYVIAQKPDVIILGPAEGVPADRASEWFLTGLELSENPDFLACYEETRATIPETGLPVRGAGIYDDLLIFIYYRRTCD